MSEDNSHQPTQAEMESGTIRNQRKVEPDESITLVTHDEIMDPRIQNFIDSEPEGSVFAEWLKALSKRRETINHLSRLGKILQYSGIVEREMISKEKEANLITPNEIAQNYTINTDLAEDILSYINTVNPQEYIKSHLELEEIKAFAHTLISLPEFPANPVTYRLLTQAFIGSEPNFEAGGREKGDETDKSGYFFYILMSAITIPTVVRELPNAEEIIYNGLMASVGLGDTKKAFALIANDCQNLEQFEAIEQKWSNLLKARNWGDAYEGYEEFIGQKERYNKYSMYSNVEEGSDFSGLAVSHCLPHATMWVSNIRLDIPNQSFPRNSRIKLFDEYKKSQSRKLTIMKYETS